MAPTTKRKHVHSKNPSLDLSMRPAKQPKQSNTSPFADLPTELVQHVFTFLDTATLKDVRLGCSIWAYDLVGPFMFETVTLIPHLYFMDRFLYTFRPSRLNIRTMRIDVRWIEQMVGLHQNYQNPEGWYRPPKLVRESRYDIKHRAHPSSCYTLEELFDIYGDDRTEHLRALESGMLGTIFSIMTSLRTIKMNFFTDIESFNYWGGARSSANAPYPPALKALLGQFNITRLGSFSSSEERPVYPPPSVYLSIVGPLVAATPQLKSLLLAHFDPTKLLYDSSTDIMFDPKMDNCIHPWKLFTQVLNRLSYLDVQITGDQGEVEQDLADAMCRMLRSVPKLPSLKLHVHAALPCQIDRNRAWTAPISAAHDKCIPLLRSFLSRPIQSAALPNLKELWLRNVACTAQELEHFLNLETPHLRSLILNNIVLLSPYEQRDHLACWIRTFKHLRGRLRLERLEFRGYMTNLGRQHWHIETDSLRHLHYPSCLKMRMIRWFLDKNATDDACPLNGFRIMEGELDVIEEDSILHSVTDLSWNMLCLRDSGMDSETDSGASGSDSGSESSSNSSPD